MHAYQSGKKFSPVLILALSLIFLFLAVIVSLATGSAEIPLNRVLATVLTGEKGTEYSIIMGLRFPRIILGFAVGGSLSLAGVILQSMFRNPLVEPYTVGISGGAALGVSICFFTKMNFLFTGALPLSGFIGASMVIVLLYLLNARRRMLNMEGLLLTGVMVSFISSSLVTLILAISKAEDLHNIIFWIMGSLEQPGGPLVFTVFCISLISLVLSYCFSLHMNALSLGDEEAVHLGINTEKTKSILFLMAALLTGISVSVSGLIGFVGLIVPHFVRGLVGYDHRRLLFISFIIGAGFLIFCDTIARTIIAPVQLPVGVITGFCGGSIFIYVLCRKMMFGIGGRL